MKKYLFILATAAIVASCSNLDTFKQINNTAEDGENGAAIGFTSFTDKVTKGTAENSEALYTWTFFDHQESFKVWARKAGQPADDIFDGTIVTVTAPVSPATAYTYAYSPARFWDKNATKYHFYAAAPAEPADGAWEFEDGSIVADASLNAGYFTTATLLNGVNLKNVENSGPGADLSNIFKTATVDGTANGAKDIDKLIAAPCEVVNTYYNKANPDAVNLNFIHILSKLNVTISTSLYDENHTYDVDLLAFEIHNIPNAGTFSEATAIPNDKKIIRWTRTGTTTTNILTGIDNSTNKVDVANPSAANAAANATGAKTYIVESLIMPQNIEYERVALDGQAHIAINEDSIPFASYEEYTQAKHDDVDRLTQAQFGALFNNGVFVEWDNYNHNLVAGEKYTLLIDEATFDARVADATKEGTASPYADFAEYTATKGNDATLTEEQFDALIDNGAFVSWDNYTPLAGEYVDNRINEAEFNRRIKEATKTPAINIPAYTAVSESSKPYFVVTYSIDDDVFTQYFNLAAAFKNYTNNEKVNGEEGELTDAQKKFGFYEGWQNTLNIIINPTKIEFTADVATWSTEQSYDYDIERGNE